MSERRLSTDTRRNLLDREPKEPTEKKNGHTQNLSLPTIGVSGGLVGVILWVHANFLMPQVMTGARQEAKSVVVEYIRQHEKFPHRHTFTADDGEKLEARYEKLVTDLRGRIEKLTSTNARIEAQLELILERRKDL